MSAAPVAITGGLGFIGRRLGELLAADGHPLLVIDDASVGSPEDPPGELARADVRDEGAVAAALAAHRPETVYHLAAVHFIPDCEADPARAIAVNVEGTRSVLEACAATGTVGEVVVASSAAVYAPGDGPHSEDDPLGPIDVYGHTKLWTEQLAALAHRRRGLAVGIARLFNGYGPRETQPHLLPAVLAGLAAGGPLRLGNLDTVRDYVFVDDLARGLAALGPAVRDAGALTANLGSEEGRSGHELVAAAAAAAGVQPELQRDPDRVRSEDRPRLVSDCSRARERLGWEPATPFEDGLRRALERPLAQKGVKG